MLTNALIDYVASDCHCWVPSLMFKKIGKRNVGVISVALNSFGFAKKLEKQLNLPIRLYLLIPVTLATAERSCSAMCRLSTHLRKTMTTEQLNACAVLHIHYMQTCI
jgi:hypothetical protein